MIPPSELSDAHHSVLVCSVTQKILEGHCFKESAIVVPLVLVYRGSSPNYMQIGVLGRVCCML